MLVKRYPNLKKEVGGSIPDCEISSVLDGKPARWPTASRAFTLACRPFVSPRKIKKSREVSCDVRIPFVKNHGDEDDNKHGTHPRGALESLYT
jgi:hypothetical protein